MLQHVIDAERIFAYRAMRIARGESQNLISFDENEYAANSNADARSWIDIVKEWEIVRKSSIFLFDSFNDEMLSRVGVTNQNNTSVISLGFITVGHLMHHKNILNERYL